GLNDTTKKWLGTLLITLSQFDRINNEQQLLRAANNLDKTDQSFESIWTVLNQVITSVDPTPFLQDTQTSRFSKHISSIQNTLDIIADIQQKNFLPAVQKSLKLIDNYYNIAETNSPIVNSLARLGEARFTVQNGKMILR